MNEEDFACSSFAPQRWRKDVCRKCYQPLRLHEKKKDRFVSVTKPSQTTSPVLTSNVKVPVSRPKDIAHPIVQDEFRDKPDPPLTNRLSDKLSGPSPQEATQPTYQQSSTGPSSPTLSKDQSKHTELSKDHSSQHTSKVLPCDGNPINDSSSDTENLSKATDSQSQLVTRRSSCGGPPPRPPPRSSSISDSAKFAREKTKEKEKLLQSATSFSSQKESSVDSSSCSTRSVPPRPPPRSASTSLQTVKLDYQNESSAKDSVSEQPLSSMAALSALLCDDDGEISELIDKEQGLGIEQMASLLAEEESFSTSHATPLQAATTQPFQEDEIHASAAPDSDAPSQSPLPPPPPPPPPPIVPPSPALSFRVHVDRRHARSIDENPASNNVEENIDEFENNQGHEPASSAHQAAMDLIVSGVSLRHVSPPPEREPIEEAVVDVASEMRIRVQNLRKKEVEAHSDKLEQLRPQISQLLKDLTSARTPTYLHILIDLLKRIHRFIEECGVPVEFLINKLNWPSKLVDDLQEVVSSMAKLEEKVIMAEKVCQQAMESEQLNVEVVHQCVMQVITTATLINRSRDQDSRYTRASSSFPVDQIDIHRLVQRATAAVTPLLDKLYKKALQSHLLVNDPTVSKYDHTFRLQNAVRLLRMCCNMSDSLSNSLEIPRHPQYSEAMLKAADLNTTYQKQLAILEKRGDWDSEEAVNLQAVNSNKRSSLSQKNQATVSQVIVSVLGEGGTIDDAVEAVSMTQEVFLQEETQLIKSVVASGSTNMVDQIMQIRKMFCGGDESLLHRHDFDWLHEALIKSKPECIENLVKVHDISIDCCSPDAGNSLLHIASRRQDWSMMQFLVKLEANPLVVNSSSRTPLELLGIKCFPQQHFHELKQKELPFDLESYINNPSLSDVVLVSNEGEKFYAHRLMLCGQSPVFHSMMESEVWKNTNSQDGEVTLSSVSSCTLRLLLQYLYTGRSTFPQDDLNTWIDLLAASTEFLLDPLKLQCEKTLSAQIDNEVVLPMYYAAVRFSANKLLINCCHHLLINYKLISDEGHEALKHLLENGETFAPK